MERWATPSAPGVASGLSACEVYTSCVVERGLSSAWQAVRDWGRAPWLKGSGDLTFRVLTLGGTAATEVGGVRVLRLGNSQMFEQLTALDDEEHFVRWKLISHPQTVSPFNSASFVNYVASMRLRPVTVGSSTFVEWKARFFTEPHNAPEIRLTVESWCLTGFQNLQAYLLAEKHSQPLQPGGSEMGFGSSVSSFNHTPQSSPAAAGYAAARNSFLQHQKLLKPERQRFVGTLTNNGGTPMMHGNASDFSSRVSQEGCASFRQAYSGESEPMSSTTSQPSPASSNVSQRTSLRDQMPPRQRQSNGLPEGPGPPSGIAKLTKASKSSSSLGMAGAAVKSMSSSSQPADSRSSSWNSDKQEQGNNTSAAGLGEKQSLMKSKSSAASMQMASSHLSFGTSDESASNSRGSDKQSDQDFDGRGKYEPDPRLDAETLKLFEAKLPASAKEVASVQVDDVLMQKLAQQLEVSWVERETNAARTSFEEAAAQLEERHNQLHKARRSAAIKPTQDSLSPFSSPFASPFSAPPTEPKSVDHGAGSPFQRRRRAPPRMRELASESGGGPMSRHM